ncbi:MAG: SMC-Scp complex subunit ScpB [Planctomycetota bacterium]|nr:SMC-Scp complex subunit ScpB [Planctomycetota bacterium]
MDDISRESLPEHSGGAPVSERQKGPEEVVRFERGQVGEADAAGASFEREDRIEFSHAAPVADEAPSTVEPAMSVERPEDPDVDKEQAEIDEADARAAVDAEAETASIEQDLDELVDTEIGEDGLPVVPQLEDVEELARVLYVMMLSSREGMTVFRLAQACNTTQKLVEAALERLQEQLRTLSLPVELTRVGDSVRWMSKASTFPYLQRLKGVKKLEKLSPAALETLAVVAYRQPVMRSEIEAIRGVKAGPMIRTLLQHKLVKVAGRADVPGRPLQYGTTPHFLERFGLTSLQDLPSVKEWKNLG